MTRRKLERCAMSREAFCQLTAGDLNILMSMLDETGHTESFTILLREKLNYASVFFREDRLHRQRRAHRTTSSGPQRRG